MTDKPCPYCRGNGTNTWCQYCGDNEPVDVFGQPYTDGREGTWIQTWSGRTMWPLSPRAEDFEIMDIAIGLARENRYGKQTIKPYKVAEHSVVVSVLVGKFARGNGMSEECAVLLEREGLLHDCDEGILPDMPRPLKHEPAMRMDQFRLAGKRIRECAFGKFGITSTKESHEIIDAIDKRLVLDEVRQVMRNPELYIARHGHLKPCGVKLDCLGEDAALDLFLRRFEELFPEHCEIDLGTTTFLP
jgi:hypothetical protein